jgi:hypothetical protein
MPSTPRAVKPCPRLADDSHGQRTVNVLAFFKRHLRLIARVGGILLIALGLVEATGTWTLVVAWMHTHWFQTYSPQL